MKVILYVDKDYDDYANLCKHTDFLISKQTDVEIVIPHTGINGLAERYIKDRGLNFKEFKVSALYGEVGAFVQSDEITNYGDALVVFHKENNKVLNHLVLLAKKRELKIKVYGIEE